MYSSLEPSPSSSSSQPLGEVPVQYAFDVSQSAVPPSSMQNAHVEIIEQPAPSSVRFRYKSDVISAGCIRGAKNSEELKTYPTIKVHGYQGSAICVVSFVTANGPPYYPHPHNLVGKQTDGTGVSFKVINTPDMICSFPNLGIQRVKRTEIRDSLRERQQLKVDPFGTGFSHCDNLNQINLNAVRLCFQVTVADSTGKYCITLPPVISDPIYDGKAASDLNISKLSHSSSPVTGGQQIILLCDEVNKDDIEILFYEERAGNVMWSEHGKFSSQQVHRKAAIIVAVPTYRSMNISEPVEISVQLRRPSDGVRGKPMKFTYLPLKYGFEQFPQYNPVGLSSLENVHRNPNQVFVDGEVTRQLFPPQTSTNGFISSPPAGHQSATGCTNKIQQQLGSTCKKEDILAIASETIHENSMTGNEHYENSAEDMLECFESLDLGFDPADLEVTFFQFLRSYFFSF